MHKRKQLTLRHSLLSCAIALAASGATQSALAVDLCTGDASITVSTADGGQSCSLDTANASLSVTSTGEIDDQVYVAVNGTSISNAGSISAFSTSAIYYDGADLDGSLSNSGEIVGYASDSSYAYAYGIYVGGELSGKLGNSGSISANAWAGSYYANATALDVSGDLSGTLSNSGLIEASASAESSAYAYAVQIGNDLSGTLSNGGTIRAVADADDYSAYASALYVDGDLSGKLANSGLIEASATASSSASAYGVMISGNVSGTFANSGIVRAEALASDSYTAYASALYVGGDVSGNLLNSGTVLADANGYTNASAYAVYVEGSLTSTATLANSGTIKANALAQNSNASAWALYIDSQVDSVVSNSGTVNATARAQGSTATAQALYIGDGLAGKGAIVNSGTISANATGYDYGYATAIELGGEHSYQTVSSGVDYAAMSGSAAIVNSGTILADAYGRYGDGEAYAIAISGDLAEQARIQNNAGGAIKAIAKSAYTSASATAIYAYDLRDNALIVNNGLIQALANSAADYSYATGIDVDSLYDDAGIINNEMLQVIASGQEYASANGIEADYLYDNARIVNNGTLDVLAKSVTSYSASAYGISAYSLYDNARVINNGTLTVTAEGPEHSADAYGIELDDLNGTSAVVNNGTITVTAIAQEYSGSAYGIDVDSLYDEAVLLNDGKIVVTAEGYSSAEAYGISADSLSGEAVLVNKGTITVSATAATSSAQAYGISLGSVGDDAMLLNSGKIDVTAYGTADAYAYAYGIDMGSIDDDGVVINTSSIRATATVDASSSAYAYGIDMGSVNGNGVLMNKGSIVADATSKIYQAYAYGISMESIGSAGNVVDEIDAVTNAAGGVIIARAEGDTSASAYGISAGDLYGTASLTNKGSIQATALNHYSSSAYAYGISTGRVEDTAKLSNRGAITVDATNMAQSGDDSAYAYGILTSNIDTGGSIVNDGVIKVSASAAGGTASAFGIYARLLSGTVENNGTINVTATTTSADEDDGAYAWGIYAGGSESFASAVGDSGSIINTGTLNGGVYAGTNYFYNCNSGCSYLGSSSISLTNSGSITTAATTDSYVSGDYTQLGGGSLGFVLRSQDDYGQLYVEGSADFTESNTVKLYADPKASLADGDVLYNVVYADTLVAADGFDVADMSAFYNFAVVEHANGFDVTVEALNPLAVLSGAGLSLTSSQADLVEALLADEAPEAFDPLRDALGGASSAAEAASVLESFGPALAGAASYATRVAGAGASNAISARMGESRGAASGDAFSQNAVWIKPFLGMAEQDAANGMSGYDVDTTGFVIGIDGDLNDDVRVGVAVASAQSDLEGGSANLDIDTTQFTLYGSYALGSATALDVDLSYGANSYDSTRNVSFAGSKAVADYDGTQLALGATLSHRKALGDKAALVPSFSLRYSQVEIDGYSETGAAPFNLTVADSDDDAIQAVAKAGYELTLSNKGVFLANLGLGYDTIDQASATATVSSVGQTFVSNGIEPESMMVVGGLGYRHVTAKGLEITAAWDAESRSDFLANNLSVKFRLPF